MTWRVLHLKPRTEKRIAEVCQRQGLPYYLPLRKSLRLYQRRKVLFELPLFPGYLFVAVNATQRALLFRGNHVVRVLKPESQMGLLRQLVQVRRLLRLDPELETVDPIRCGELARIKGGPLAGFEGIVTRLRKKPGKRLVVLNIEIVGRAVAVETEAIQIERIGAPRPAAARATRGTTR
jgi:transcriptional antiterminator RfaH